MRKVHILDIETSPMLAYIWQLGEQRVNLGQIHTDWNIMAWSAKELGAPAEDIVYYDTRKNPQDDRAILIPLWKLLNETDILITQNGKKFDAQKINARFIEHGMKPPRPYRHLDTYLIARQTADFTSHSLEYLTDKLCTRYKKLSHKKFPGMSLWVECLKGNRKAWEEMKLYNTHDVLATEELYTKVRAWAPKSAPNIYDEERICKCCGSKKVWRKGEERTKTGVTPKLHCQTCGKWQSGERIKI